MTSLLYMSIQQEMRMNKPNHPDEIWLGKEDYSAWTDWRVNGWLLVAALISGASDILLPHVVSQWSWPVRAIIAVVPFVAILLWVRSLKHWIGGMDELHRRIMAAATLISLGGTFFVVILWHRLNMAGVFPAGGNWDIATVGHSFLLMTFFYFLGFHLSNRHFR